MRVRRADCEHMTPGVLKHLRFPYAMRVSACARFKSANKRAFCSKLRPSESEMLCAILFQWKVGVAVPRTSTQKAGDHILVSTAGGTAGAAEVLGLIKFSGAGPALDRCLVVCVCCAIQVSRAAGAKLAGLIQSKGRHVM